MTENGSKKLVLDCVQNEYYEFICKICNTSIKREESFYRHVGLHHPKYIVWKNHTEHEKMNQLFNINYWKDQCVLCGESFSRQDDLCRHFGNIHKGKELIYNVNIKYFEIETIKIPQFTGAIGTDFNFIKQINEKMYNNSGTISSFAEEYRTLHSAIIINKAGKAIIFSKVIHNEINIVIEDANSAIEELKKKKIETLMVIVIMKKFSTFFKKSFGRYEKTFQLHRVTSKETREAIYIQNVRVFCIKVENSLNMLMRNINYAETDPFAKGDYSQTSLDDFKEIN